MSETIVYYLDELQELDDVFNMRKGDEQNWIFSDEGDSVSAIAEGIIRTIIKCQKNGSTETKDHITDDNALCRSFCMSDFHVTDPTSGVHLYEDVTIDICVIVDAMLRLMKSNGYSIVKGNTKPEDTPKTEDDTIIDKLSEAVSTKVKDELDLSTFRSEVNKLTNKLESFSEDIGVELRAINERMKNGVSAPSEVSNIIPMLMMANIFKSKKKADS